MSHVYTFREILSHRLYSKNSAGRLQVALTFLEQLVLPFFMLVPVRICRLLAGLLEIMFQASIEAWTMIQMQDDEKNLGPWKTTLRIPKKLRDEILILSLFSRRFPLHFFFENILFTKKNAMGFHWLYYSQNKSKMYCQISWSCQTLWNPQHGR